MTSNFREGLEKKCPRVLGPPWNTDITVDFTGTWPCRRKLPTMFGITLDIESFSLELQNCSERLRTSLDVFGSLRKTSDMFVSSSEILVLSG